VKFREEGLINRLWRSLNVKKREIYFLHFASGNLRNKNNIWWNKLLSPGTLPILLLIGGLFWGLSRCKFNVLWDSKLVCKTLGGKSWGQDWWNNDISIQNLETTCTNEGIGDAPVNPHCTFTSLHYREATWASAAMYCTPTSRAKPSDPFFDCQHLWNTLPVKNFAGRNAGP
jgi:hypothetical protein